MLWIRASAECPNINFSKIDLISICKTNRRPKSFGMCMFKHYKYVCLYTTSMSLLDSYSRFSAHMLYKPQPSRKLYFCNVAMCIDVRVRALCRPLKFILSNLVQTISLWSLRCTGLNIFGLLNSSDGSWVDQWFV